MLTSPEVAVSNEGKAIVLYDGECPLCRRSVAILKRLDWLHRLAFQDANDVANLPRASVALDPVRLLQEMHLLTPDRTRVYAGYRAFRWMAWRLPLTFGFAPWMYLPGVPWVGNKIYLWVAKNRLNLVPCTDGQCRVELKKG